MGYTIAPCIFFGSAPMGSSACNAAPSPRTVALGCSVQPVPAMSTPALAALIQTDELLLLEDGHCLRDQALAVSGLLSQRIGGSPVKTYQPAGVWEEATFGTKRYEQDHGESLYRRSMYTFWKRTVPPPSLQTFDAPEREFCIVRRSTTNTPLQALVLMNDPTFKVGVRIASTQSVGVLSGEGGDNFIFQLLDPTGEIKVGDVLIARGSDGGRPFVPGVPVGIVTSIFSNPNAITQTADVKSMANLNSLGVVSVVTAAPKNDPRDSLVPKIFLPRIADSVTATATPSASPSAKPSPTKK